MTYRGLERERVIQLLPINLCQYLRATGWERFTELPERVAGKIAVFRRTLDGELQEVIVPMACDEEKYFFRRMAEAVSDLAGYEDRDATEIVVDLSTDPANDRRPEREPEESSFVGTVEELAGSPGTDGRPEGRVTLRLQDGDELLTAHVDLDADDYARAADAHLKNRPIEIWGTLRRRARIHKITRYDRIEIVDS